MKKKGMLLFGLVVVMLFTSCGTEDKSGRSFVKKEVPKENPMQLSAEKETEVSIESESEEAVNSEQNDEGQQIDAEEKNYEEEQEENVVESDSSENDTEENEKQEETDVSDASSGAVNPELKAFLDEYEAFMDEYVEFMEKYNDSGYSVEMLSDYLKMMDRYADFAETADKYDSEEMSAADAAYYIEVTSRVSKKMLEVAY